MPLFIVEPKTLGSKRRVNSGFQREQDGGEDCLMGTK